MSTLCLYPSVACNATHAPLHAIISAAAIVKPGGERVAAVPHTALSYPTCLPI